jgi:hypothetical protein
LNISASTLSTSARTDTSGFDNWSSKTLSNILQQYIQVSENLISNNLLNTINHVSFKIFNIITIPILNIIITCIHTIIILSSFSY